MEENDELIFLVDHLAAFGSDEVLNCNEAIDKLMRLNEKRGILPISCLLEIHLNNYLVLRSTESREEIERFPLSRVYYPAAYMQADKRIECRNLLLFSVSLLPEGAIAVPGVVVPHYHRWEMYIFQCVNGAAHDIANVIQGVKDGTWKRRSDNSKNGNNLPRTHPNMLPRYPLHSEKPFERTIQSTRHNTEINLNSEEARMEHILNTLNACLADIESFANRLDHIVKATRKAAVRSSIRISSKKLEEFHGSAVLGEGLLNFRSRMPTLMDFVDVFKKIKFSFICIPLLQSTLQQPNASEIVHSLFSQLRIFVLICEELARGGTEEANEIRELPQRVVSPLLTMKTFHLLWNCLSSQEMELWKRLGDAWALSRDEWRGHVPPFEPHFMNGFRCDVKVILGERGTIDAEIRPEDDFVPDARPSHLPRTKLQRSQTQDSYVNKQPPSRQSSFQHISKSSHSNGDDKGYNISVTTQTPFGSPSMHSYVGTSQTPYLQNRLLVSPVTTIQPSPSQSPSLVEQTAFIKSVVSRNGKLYRVIRQRMAYRAKEISVYEGEVVEVLDDNRQYWRIRNSRGEDGYTLNACLEPLVLPGMQAGDVINSPLPFQAHSLFHEVPPPPPPPPPSSAPPSDSNKKKLVFRLSEQEAHQISTKKSDPQRTLQQQQATAIADELRQRQKLALVNKTSSPTSPINQPRISNNSSPADVRQWLHYKCFADDVLKAFAEYNGKAVFDMDRSRIEELIRNKEEASRLLSLLTVQKKISGYGTVSSHELKSRLQKRREKLEREADSSTPEIHSEDGSSQSVQ